MVLGLSIPSGHELDSHSAGKIRGVDTEASVTGLEAVGGWGATLACVIDGTADIDTSGTGAGVLNSIACGAGTWLEEVWRVGPRVTRSVALELERSDVLVAGTPMLMLMGI